MLEEPFHCRQHWLCVVASNLNNGIKWKSYVEMSALTLHQSNRRHHRYSLLSLDHLWLVIFDLLSWKSLTIGQIVNAVSLFSGYFVHGSSSSICAVTPLCLLQFFKQSRFDMQNATLMKAQGNLYLNNYCMRNQLQNYQGFPSKQTKLLLCWGEN